MNVRQAFVTMFASRVKLLNYEDCVELKSFEASWSWLKMATSNPVWKFRNPDWIRIKLIEVEGKKHIFESDDVDEIRRLKKSIMPEELLEEFTSEQAADMLAFLKSLKKPNSSAKQAEQK